MKLTHTLATLSIAALTLVGCSGTQANEEPQSAEEAQQQYADELEEQGIDPMQGFGPMQAGEFETYTEHGGHITLQLPASPNSDDVADIEQYRQDVNANTPVTYLTADVDNRDGTDSIGMWKVKAFDEQGQEYEFVGVTEYLDSTDESYGSHGIDLYNDHLHGVEAAGRDTLVLIHEGDDLPDEFTRVAVWPNGALEEVDAYPAE